MPASYFPLPASRFPHERERNHPETRPTSVLTSTLSLSFRPRQVEAVNNYAICAMYTCELALAVKTLEELIREVSKGNEGVTCICLIDAQLGS